MYQKDPSDISCTKTTPLPLFMHQNDTSVPLYVPKRPLCPCTKTTPNTKPRVCTKTTAPLSVLIVYYPVTISFSPFFFFFTRSPSALPPLFLPHPSFILAHPRERESFVALPERPEGATTTARPPRFLPTPPPPGVGRRTYTV